MAPLKLVPRCAETNRGVLTVLKNIKEAADAEGFAGIAIAAVDRAGYCHTVFEPGENMSTLIGAVERLKYRLLNVQEGS